MNERTEAQHLPTWAGNWLSPASVECSIVTHPWQPLKLSHFLKLSTIWWYWSAVPLGVSFDFPGSCCCRIPFHVCWPFVFLLWGSCSYTVNVFIESLASKLLLVVDTYVLQITGVFLFIFLHCQFIFIYGLHFYSFSCLLREIEPYFKCIQMFLLLLWSQKVYDVPGSSTTHLMPFPSF